jgi:hypothetical protein
VSVRANAPLGESPVADAATHQDFFAALDKAMFLTLQRVNQSHRWGVHHNSLSRA